MTPSPASNDDNVPWVVRYMLPLSGLAIAAILLFVAWLVNL